MILALRDATSRHDAGRSLYGRSKARLPTRPASWPTRRGTSPIMVLMARVDAGPPHELARLASLQLVATRPLEGTGQTASRLRQPGMVRNPVGHLQPEELPERKR